MSWMIVYAVVFVAMLYAAGRLRSRWCLLGLHSLREMILRPGAMYEHPSKQP